MTSPLNARHVGGQLRCMGHRKWTRGHRDARISLLSVTGQHSPNAEVRTSSRTHDLGIHVGVGVSYARKVLGRYNTLPRKVFEDSLHLFPLPGGLSRDTPSQARAGPADPDEALSNDGKIPCQCGTELLWTPRRPLGKEPKSPRINSGQRNLSTESLLELASLEETQRLASDQR